MFPEVTASYPAAIGEDAIERFLDYRRAMRWLDDEFARILASLEAGGLSDRTVVILASDHGYEFDEYGLGYIGHASNYGRYQLRSTLAIRWPGRPAETVDRRTSHYSVPSTLLTKVLGCSNDPLSYAFAGPLDTADEWPWIFAGSYSSNAIVEPDRVTVINPGGLPTVLGQDLRASPDLKLDTGLLSEALSEMRRFYR